MQKGVYGLLRDKTRKPGEGTAARRDRPARARPDTRRPARRGHALERARDAQATGIGAVSVQRIWQAHGLTPHRMKTFKLSNDPKFAEKFSDVVGFYVDPPAHAVVLSIDETSQIQALDRTQPGLPMKKGRAETMTHDYIRHGTTTLQNSVQIFPDSLGKQRPKLSTQGHAIIRPLCWRIWSVGHRSDCENSISPFGGQGEHQFDRA